EKQIIFTSNQETPSAGYWSGIRFYDTSDDATSILEHCIVEYTGARGYGGTYGGIYIYKSAPTIRNCTIRHSSNYGVYIHSGAPTISNSLIKDNTSWGIYAVGGSATISGNTITGASPLLVPVNVLGNTTISLNNVLSDGGYINVQGGTITQDATWPALQFKITGHVTIQGTDGDDGITTLTLTPGAKLLFGQNIYFHVGGNSGSPGALVAKGLPEKQIIFT
ncbi:MAG: right-handed parallel beta-helix repeat-containing protein, partial [Desulfobacterales bacterium]|nr:right-handed parallel beta-helix repeat-containing protein [Desulfobacterales bacterium]